MNVNVNLSKKPKIINSAEFLILSTIYNSPENRLLIKKFITYFAGEDIFNLESLGFVKINSDSISLRKLGLDIFEDGVDDKFIEFISVFPNTVPNGRGGKRPVSPNTVETKEGSKLRKKWNLVTKGNTELQDKVIKCLEAEIEYRTRQGDLQFMNNAETWLNNHNYEKYEFLLEESVDDSNRGEKTI